MIPKKIHYCWFGRNPKPALAEKCIRSWRKYCRDYEIIEWNEDNFDISAAPLYVQQAYEAKKWAFVTDYVRLWALTGFGGIYLDTDVEVVKKLDRFLEHEAFSGFEDGIKISTAVMACEKGFPLFETFLRHYDDLCFLNPDGSYNYTTNVQTLTEICLSHGLVQNNAYQVIGGLALYPKDVFSPVSYQTGKLKRTVHTAAIHWFSGSWQPAKMQEQRRLSEQYHREEERKEFAHNAMHLPNRIGRKLLGDARYEALKRKLKRN